MSDSEYYLFRWTYHDGTDAEKNDSGEMLICLNEVVGEEEGFDVRFGRYLRENVDDFENLLDIFRNGVLINSREDFPTGFQIQMDEGWDNIILEIEELVEKFDGMIEEEITEMFNSEYIIDTGYGYNTYKGSFTKIEEIVRIDD